jgi:hypothetical protein
MIRVIEKDGRPGAKAKGYDVTILCRPFEVIAKDITVEINQVSKKGESLRTGRHSPRSDISLRTTLD